MNEAKSFENTGSTPLELMVIGVSRNMATKTALIIAAGTLELDSMTPNRLRVVRGTRTFFWAISTKTTPSGLAKQRSLACMTSSLR